MGYIYHYHAFYQKDGSNISHHDGIAIISKRIETYDDYLNLKKILVEENNMNVNPENLIIDNFSLIGENNA